MVRAVFLKRIYSNKKADRQVPPTDPHFWQLINFPNIKPSPSPHQVNHPQTQSNNRQHSEGVQFEPEP